MRATLTVAHKGRNADCWRLMASLGSWLIRCASGRLGAVPDTLFLSFGGFRESKTTSWFGAADRRRRMWRHSRAAASRWSVIRRRAHARLGRGHPRHHDAERHDATRRWAHAGFRGVNVGQAPGGSARSLFPVAQSCREGAQYAPGTGQRRLIRRRATPLPDRLAQVNGFAR